MPDTHNKKVCFLTVSDAASKLHSICLITHKHFNRKEPVLIAVPSQEAAVYIDQLLWRQPADSFLPHAISHAATSELVVISTSTVNINKAKAIINLCSDVPANVAEYALVYDLFDLTHPTKEQFSRARMSAYQALGYVIEE